MKFRFKEQRNVIIKGNTNGRVKDKWGGGGLQGMVYRLVIHQFGIV